MDLASLLQSAFGGMIRGPMPLAPAVDYWARQHGSRVTHLENQIIRRLEAEENDPVRGVLERQLSEWDYVPVSASWNGRHTEPITPERRRAIYDRLKLGEALRRTLDEEVLIYRGSTPILIDAPGARGHWYTETFRESHRFYWDRLKTYLREVRHISSTALTKLDDAAIKVVERLDDPAAPQPRRARGLVVGYVQSGKTTNFTAVMAKAIDAGYRLVIVLSGTTNMLRNQTQRRLDMELIGVENICRGASEENSVHEYKGSAAWTDHKFIRYGALPSELGWVDIIRLTSLQDFRKEGTNKLLGEKKVPKRPLYDRKNLEHAAARVIVIKKQADRLAHLLEELTAAGDRFCAEVPALIIDDESDQASVNTIDPKKVRKKSVAQMAALRKAVKAGKSVGTNDNGRTAINLAIVEVLHKLKRSQYVGYTATPFANVFIDPDDVEDIYPKDFVLSLDRPDAYIGAREFHDFDVLPPGPNEKAFVRDIRKRNDRLMEAIDAFVLTGALKAYRESKKQFSEPHHTMLVHASQLKGKHEQMVKEIRHLWNTAGYDSPGPGLERLKKLFQGDFRRVWKERGKPVGLSYPASFESLKRFIGTALDLMQTSKNGPVEDPVLMVNSADGASVPDFDGDRREWKIIVGGAKLSRGYTVAGLSVSYFRRSSKMQDTLMQMGRWFGYRPGYHDLVRLYIGREEKDGKRKESFDLYEAFKAVCADEEEFREQLKQYEKRPDGGQLLTPLDVPALVYNSHPRLRPVARSKMHHAQLTLAEFRYKESTTQAVNGRDRASNERLIRELLEETTVSEHGVAVRKPTKESFSAWVAPVEHSKLMKVLRSFRWREDSFNLAAEVNYLAQANAPVKRWLIVAPQLKKLDTNPWKVAGRKFSCFRRQEFPTRFGVFSDPGHRDLAKWLVGAENVQLKVDGLEPDVERGVLLLYPTYEKRLGKKPKVVPVMGFALSLPRRGTGEREVFTVVPAKKHA